MVEIWSEQSTWNNWTFLRLSPNQSITDVAMSCNGFLFGGRIVWYGLLQADTTISSEQLLLPVNSIDHVHDVTWLANPNKAVQPV